MDRRTDHPHLLHMLIVVGPIPMEAAFRDAVEWANNFPDGVGGISISSGAVIQTSRSRGSQIRCILA